jgi:TolB-like protein
VKKVIPVFWAGIFLMFCFWGTGFSKDKITIAVLDFEAKNIGQQSADAVTDLLRTELFNSGRFKVIERERVKRIIEEQRFQSSGLTDSDKVVEIGRLLNVQKIMIGTVNLLGSDYYVVNTRMVDVQSGQVDLAEKTECQGGEEELPKAITKLALNIAFKIGLEGAIIRVNEDNVFIDVGRVDGVQVGQVLNVIRAGETITDLEGRAIGTRDEVIGSVAITDVQDKFSIASIQDKGTAFNRGDKVIPPRDEEPPAAKPKVDKPKPKPKPETDKDDKLETPIIF